MADSKFDVIIVGAGPLGLASGIEAKKNGLTHLIIEKGCLVNSIYNYPTNMVFFSTSDRLEIGEVPFISHGVKPTRTEALEYYRRVKTAWDLNVDTYEEVREINREDDSFKVITNKGDYLCNYVIISTGFFDYPNLIGIPGEDLPKVKHYYVEPHPHIDQRIIVIGGGNSAVDVALETFRRGADVTMVIKNNNLENNVKYWVKPDIENRIEEGSIKAFFNSTVTEIREKKADISTPDGIITVENDFVFAMTGYHPDFELLKRAGVDLNGNFLIPQYDPETFETNVKGLFLAGVVCCGMDTGKWFIENSRYHAENIFKYLKKVNS